jgi:hypothetical protein
MRPIGPDVQSRCVILTPLVSGDSYGMRATAHTTGDLWRSLINSNLYRSMDWHDVASRIVALLRPRLKLVSV